MKNGKDNLDKNVRFAAIGGGILLLAVIAGILVMVLTSPRNAKPEPTPTPAPTPEPTVTATETPAQPTVIPITAIRLYAYGRELTQDGFTLYVGDQPVELTAVVEPAEITAPVGWTLDDMEAAALEVSSDGRTVDPDALPESYYTTRQYIKDVTKYYAIYEQKYYRKDSPAGGSGSADAAGL